MSELSDMSELSHIVAMTCMTAMTCTDVNLSDLFTKAHTIPRFKALVDMIKDKGLHGHNETD